MDDDDAKRLHALINDFVDKVRAEFGDIGGWGAVDLALGSLQVIARATIGARTTDGSDPNDMDVFDSMRSLLARGIDLDDRAAVERALGNVYAEHPQRQARFVAWCIKAAKANQAAGGLEPEPFGESGFVPPEFDEARPGEL
jgi:hypothetical protein